MNYLSVFLKPILLIILISLLYITLVKPARLIANNKIYYPLISAIFSNYKVNLPSDNSAAVIIKKKMLIMMNYGSSLPLMVFTFRAFKDYSTDHH